MLDIHKSDAELRKQFKNVKRIDLIKELVSRRDTGGWMSNTCYNLKYDKGRNLAPQAKVFHEDWDKIDRCERTT